MKPLYDIRRTKFYKRNVTTVIGPLCLDAEVNAITFYQGSVQYCIGMEFRNNQRSITIEPKRYILNKTEFLVVICSSTDTEYKYCSSILEVSSFIKGKVWLPFFY